MRSLKFKLKKPAQFDTHSRLSFGLVDASSVYFLSFLCWSGYERRKTIKIDENGFYCELTDNREISLRKKARGDRSSILTSRLGKPKRFELHPIEVLFGLWTAQVRLHSDCLVTLTVFLLVKVRVSAGRRMEFELVDVYHWR